MVLIPESLERIHGSYYDTLEFDGTRQPYKFFEFPLGECRKTISDTNMILHGCLPSPNIFVCKRLRLSFPRLLPWEISAELRHFLDVASLTFKISSKIYWKGLARSLWFESQILQFLFIRTGNHLPNDGTDLVAELDRAIRPGCLDLPPLQPELPDSFISYAMEKDAAEITSKLDRIVTEGQLEPIIIRTREHFELDLEMSTLTLKQLENKLVVRAHLDGIEYRRVY